MSDSVSFAVTTLTVVGAILTAWITSRVTAKRNSAEVKLERLQTLEARVDKLEARDRVHQDYISVLRQHIISGSPPPPPSWPIYP